MDRGRPNRYSTSACVPWGGLKLRFSIEMRDHMKKVLLAVAICMAATPAFAQIASRGSIANSARVEQAAGAMAFSQIGQGDRVTLESPRNDPLVRIDSGAFVMPYINDSFNASRGGDLRVYDPVGSYIDGDFSVTTNPIP
jgi:hypothetical protein